MTKKPKEAIGGKEIRGTMFLPFSCTHLPSLRGTLPADMFGGSGFGL